MEGCQQDRDSPMPTASLAAGRKARKGLGVITFNCQHNATQNYLRRISVRACQGGLAYGPVCGGLLN